MTVLVAITGGSGSGKSTLAAALRDALPPGRAVLVSEDWYYRDCSAFPDFDPATFDFDHVRIRDHGLMAGQLAALKRGETVTAPEYCFVSHARKSGGGTFVAPAEVVVAEGSHLLAEPTLAAVFDLKVYVDTPADVRFIRRLLRDRAERGRSVESIVEQYLATVRPAHARFTAPAKALADVVIEDSSAAAGEPDPTVTAALLAPLLRHPLLAALSSPPLRSGGGGP